MNLERTADKIGHVKESLKVSRSNPKYTSPRSFQLGRETCHEHISTVSFSSYVVQKTNWGLGRLYVEFSILHKITHTTGRTLFKMLSAVLEAATFTTPNTHNRQTSMPSAGFEIAIPAFKRLQT